MRRWVLLLALSGCADRVQDPGWTPDGDRGESGVLRGPGKLGPTYVWRRVFTDHCEFGDVPEEAQGIRWRTVGCREKWWTADGQNSLVCECKATSSR